jgi:hypothetical protein
MSEVPNEGVMVANTAVDIPALEVETKKIMNRLKKGKIGRIKRRLFNVCRFNKGFLSNHRVATLL